MGVSERVFGPLVEGRECGDCDVCCVAPKIDTAELKKEPNVRCEHAIGGGCTIYETRFSVCRGFYCLWRRIEEMPDEARPDKLGVMFGPASITDPETPFERFYIHGLAHAGPEALDTPLANGILEMLSEGDVPVWVSTHYTERMLVHPEPQIANAVIQKKDDVPKKLRKEVQAWQGGIKKHHPKNLWRHFLQRLVAR